VWIASAVIMFIHLEDCNNKIMNAKQKFVVNQWTIGLANAEPPRAVYPRGGRSNTEGLRGCSNVLRFRGVRALGHVIFARPCYWQSFHDVIAIIAHVRTHSGEYLVWSEHTR